MTIEQVREKFKGAYVSSYELAPKNLDGKYIGYRYDEDIVLVCQQLNVLTVEDYCKWYALCYLMEDPDTKEVMLVTLTFGDILQGIDHNYYPDSVIKFCSENNLKLDNASYLCICKMMIENNLEKELNKHLPYHLDLDKVLIRVPKAKSEYFHVYGRYDSISRYSLSYLDMI